MTKSQAINYLCSLGISGERIREVVEALGQESYFWEKCPYYEPDIMFDEKDEYDMGKCTYKQEPKMGRWEWVQYDGNPNIGNWHCSECNRIVCGAITAVNPIYSYKYCPNCGTKMKDEVSE